VRPESMLPFDPPHVRAMLLSRVSALSSVSELWTQAVLQFVRSQQALKPAR
jgi:hypothetical protein